jgi:hypothetical protein
MTKTTKGLDSIFVLGFGLLALAVVGVPAPSMAGPYESQLVHESVTISAIDRDRRSVTLKNADGETKTVQVPSDVKAFDTLKVGDRVDMDYYESIALKVLPKGTKPSMSESTSRRPMGQGGIATGARETTISAEILSIDPKANKVTIKGPQGNTHTVSVADPELQKRLPSLKVGQVVQMTYTEAIAASIRRSDAAPAKEQK